MLAAISLVLGLLLGLFLAAMVRSLILRAWIKGYRVATRRLRAPAPRPQAFDPMAGIVALLGGGARLYMPQVPAAAGSGTSSAAEGA